MEQLQPFLDQFKCFVPLALVDRLSSLLEELLGSWLLNAEELNDLVVVWVEQVGLPEALVALVDAVHGPEELPLKDVALDVARVDFEALL